MTEPEKQELKDILLNERQDVHRGILHVWLRQNNGDLETRVFTRLVDLLERL